MLENTSIKQVASSELQLEVLIPTATAIVCQKENPMLILVGISKKHDRPVLPGGKIERSDISSPSLEVSAATCILRELSEEVGATPTSLKLLSISTNMERDVRIIPASALYGTIAEHTVASVDPNTKVVGRHGVPDFLFLAEVEAQAVAPSAELEKLYWVDCRTLTSDSLAAGHGEFVRKYTQAVNVPEDRQRDNYPLDL